MGYYTRYKFEIEPGSEFLKALGEDIVAYAFDNSDGAKWYGHEEDIAKAMVASDTNSVSISGVGEDEGDIWWKDFKLSRSPVSVTVSMFKLSINKPTTPTNISTVNLGNRCINALNQTGRRF